MALRRSTRSTTNLKQQDAISRQEKGSPETNSKISPQNTQHKVLTKLQEAKSLPSSKNRLHSHIFNPDEISSIRKILLSWYDNHKRPLQWRTMAEIKNLDIRAYSVWVSEVMLQQTQVSTVKAYYAKWMSLWPTLQDLSKAELSQVHQTWAGLGYYSRATRLHQGAQKIVNEFQGIMPRTASSLLSELPGVGRYTAAAIASIAYNQPVGVVDGNVIRVLSRLRTVGAEAQVKIVANWFWDTADALVDPQRPGDLNQSLMELGAMVCTPRNPSCNTCPVQQHCQAFLLNAALTELTKAPKQPLQDIEDIFKEECQYCLPFSDWNSIAGVMNFPRKAKKAAARDEQTYVWVIKLSSTHKDKFLLWQRPQTGLLASLWEFPSLVVQPDQDTLPVLPMAHVEGTSKIAEVAHKFSHINQTYIVHAGSASKAVAPLLPANYQGFRWLTTEELQSAAMSTACKKVWKAYERAQASEPAHKKQKTRRKC